MSYSQDRCYIHPDSVAVEKCEKCNNLICIKCKTKHRKRRGGSEKRYVVEYIYCPPCYTKTKKRETKFKLIFYPLILIIFVVIIIIIMN